jgi:pilus assembly protein CpaE
VRKRNHKATDRQFCRYGGLNRRQVEDALKMKVDVAIPDLPRLVGQAATLGEPAITKNGGFRTGMLELVRQVAFLGILDSATGAKAEATSNSKSRRWGLFGGR